MVFAPFVRFGLTAENPSCFQLGLSVLLQSRKDSLHFGGVVLSDRGASLPLGCEFPLYRMPPRLVSNISGESKGFIPVEPLWEFDLWRISEMRVSADAEIKVIDECFFWRRDFGVAASSSLSSSPAPEHFFGDLVELDWAERGLDCFPSPGRYGVNGVGYLLDHPVV